MKVDLSYAQRDKELQGLKTEALQAYDTLFKKSGRGADFLGWTTLPEDYDKEEFRRIQEAAQKIRKESDVLVVIGIGGSYLGARAVIEAMRPRYEKMDTEVLFAGHHLSSREMKQLLDYLDDKSFSINVISKSGTTTEPAIAFRLLKAKLEEKYGAQAKDRIYVTTDRKRGALKTMADQEGYPTFVVPDDVGGRFTVLTAVGLLPIAAAGFSIEALMRGAQQAMHRYSLRSFEQNDAMRFAALRNLLYHEGKRIEILVTYEPRLQYVQEWWKQLFGESEGKENKSLFPASVVNTTDLHSMGQWIQQGPRSLFETVLAVDDEGEEIVLQKDEENLDGLNYLAGRTLKEVNDAAMEGTRQAHLDGDVPNIVIHMDHVDEETLGELFYFFEVTVGISGYMLDVNPFDQPGVEMYKSNMFHLLGKPGY